MRRLALACAVAGAAAAVCQGPSAGADELKLVNGRTYKGLVVERGADYVVFRIYTASGGKMVARYDMNQVESLNVDGKEPVFEPAKKPAAKPAPTPATPQPQPQPQPQPAAAGGEARTGKRSPAEIDALIESVGKTPPPWWDSVPLKYPDTLDLAGTKPAKGWAPQQNIGAWLWSVIDPNPPRWREGIRVLHHVLTVRKDDKPRLAETMNQLAECYQRFEQDWARSAFWRRKALATASGVGAGQVVSLAECYWMLGSQGMAGGLMRQYGLEQDGFAPAIKLYCDMGERDLALRLAKDLVAEQPMVGNVAAGEVCRNMGRYKEAIAYFEKALADPQAAKNDRYRNRAASALEAVKLYDALDLKQVANGKFRASSVGFRGPVEVEVEVRDGKILAVKVTRHQEDEYFYHLANRQMPKRIVDKQTVKAVDAVTGATVTSDAILNATAKALAGAARQ